LFGEEPSKNLLLKCIDSTHCDKSRQAKSITIKKLIKKMNLNIFSSPKNKLKIHRKTAEQNMLMGKIKDYHSTRQLLYSSQGKQKLPKENKNCKLVAG
jgi:hypothetical protein